MAGRAGGRAAALAVLAAAMAVSPGSARIADQPAAGQVTIGERTGLICLWSIYATLAEVGKRCGVVRNLPFEAELERSAARMDAYARLRSPAGAEAMADYRARAIDGDEEQCHSDALRTYAQFALATPEAVRGAADRLLASSPPVEWGTCF